MVIITCTPCIASTVGPIALGTLTTLGIYQGEKKRKRTQKKDKKKKNKKKKNKKKKNKQKGGSGYETQEEYESMLRENTFDNEEPEPEPEPEPVLGKIPELTPREKVRRECSNFLKYIHGKVPFPQEEEFAKLAFQWKDYCDGGYESYCNLCKEEHEKQKEKYMKRLVNRNKKNTMTPKVPLDLIESQMKYIPSTKRTRTPQKPRHRQINERNIYLANAAQGNLNRRNKLKKIKNKILNENVSIPNKRSTLRKTRSAPSGGRKKKKKTQKLKKR